jgi:hypothetical protein
MRFQRTLSALLILFVIGVLFIAALMAASALPVQDLAQYWAAAHLVTRNPYSLPLTTAFEKAAGISSSVPPLITKIPPWAIMLVLPLGLMGYKTTFAVWAVMSIIVVAGCAHAAWRLSGAPPSIAPAVLCLLFGPTVVLLMLGQLTVLVLLGVTLFLFLAERRRDWLAGAALLLVLGKPHVVLLFLLALVFWTIQHKRWSIILSGGLSLAAASTVAVALNPHIFAQFVERSTLVVHETDPYPNLGGILYLVSGQHMLALLPQVIGVIWLVFYWRKHRADWDWKTHGMTVLIVSVVCSYYSYPYDEVLALPALLLAYASGNRRIFLGGFVAVNLGYVIYLSSVVRGLSYMFLGWTASGWLVTYILSRSFSRVRSST